MKETIAFNRRINQICKSIWDASRTQLHLSMRHFDTAIYSFTMMRNETTKFLGTDGDRIFYNEKYVIETYEKGKIYMNRAYVHMILHCLFGHPFHRDGRFYDYWNLACDIVVESILDEWQNAAVHLSVSEYRSGLYENWKQKTHVLSAERVYEVLLKTKMTQEEFDQLLKEFETDDHSFWEEEKRQPNQPPLKQRQKKWDDISKKVQMSLEQFADNAGQDGDVLSKTLKLEKRERFQYTDFLRKFSVLREEAVIDPDSFDYNYYTYGLTMYGNMPFIEPQEWKETKKIRDFVIAIDTSMSCSGDLVREFLEQTYQVLMETDQYFSTVNIHILQCDDRVRDDTQITDLNQMEMYMQELEVKGCGGTDFRPVFDHVEQLKREKKIQDLKGLLYFTDGNGIFPKKAPDYQTAFVFMRSDGGDVQVPPWAIKLILEPQDLMRNGRTGHREDKRR